MKMYIIKIVRDTHSVVLHSTRSAEASIVQCIIKIVCQTQLPYYNWLGSWF